MMNHYESVFSKKCGLPLTLAYLYFTNKDVDPLAHKIGYINQSLTESSILKQEHIKGHDLNDHTLPDINVMIICRAYKEYVIPKYNGQTSAFCNT